MPDQEKACRLGKQIECEISDYFTKTVKIGDSTHSQPKLVRRIGLFENRIYPTGKFDKQKNYKHWFDIINPAIDSEVKNIDFDSKNIEAYSDRKNDEVPNLITNLRLKEYLRKTGQAEELNSAIEEGAGWGNVLWKRIKGSYERCDLRNTYAINQTARTVDETPIIERHQLMQKDIRAKTNWKYTDEVLKNCGQNSYKADSETQEQGTSTPYYLVFERNGEACLADVKEANGLPVEEGDHNVFVQAKVIVAAVEGSGGSIKVKYILFAQDTPGLKNSDIYKEYHRGRYKGRWFREGLYELLFDLQVRANEIGNQLARGLEWAARMIFTDDDRLVFQNITTDLKNGDLIRSKNLRQVEVRMQGFDQLIADWNRVIQQRNEIANSREVVQGVNPPSGQPLGTTQLLNTNSNKLLDFIREKLGIPLTEIFEGWIIPELIADIKASDVLRLTGDSKMLQRLYQMIVESWYVENLINMPPHGPDEAQAIKDAKLEELKKRPLFMKEFKKAFENYKPHVSIVITGENTARIEQRNTYAAFVPMESDPVRRSYLVEEAMRLSGIDVGDLPRSDPAALAGVKSAEPMPKSGDMSMNGKQPMMAS